MDAAQQSTPARTLDQRTRVLLEAPVLPTLLKLAAPNMLVMLAQMSIGLVEVYFVARLGVDALAGASLVFRVLSLISAVSQGAVGGGVVTEGGAPRRISWSGMPSRSLPSSGC